MFAKIAVQAFEAGDFLKIFLRFWGFWGLLSYKKFYKKKRVALIRYFQTKRYKITVINKSLVKQFSTGVNVLTPLLEVFSVTKFWWFFIFIIRPLPQHNTVCIAIYTSRRVIALFWHRHFQPTNQDSDTIHLYQIFQISSF